MKGATHVTWKRSLKITTNIKPILFYDFKLCALYARPVTPADGTGVFAVNAFYSRHNNRVIWLKQDILLQLFPCNDLVIIKWKDLFFSI